MGSEARGEVEKRHGGPVRDAMLTEFLDYFRTVFLRKVEDLTDEQAWSAGLAYLDAGITPLLFGFGAAGGGGAGGVWFAG